MPWRINPDTGELQFYEASTGGGGGGATNLTFVPGVNNGVVVSDSGTDATILPADSTNAGLMLASEKTKLAGIAAGAEVNVNSDWNAVSGDAEILNKPTALPPNGTAGGDLTGSYPNPTVSKVHGIDFQNGTPADNNIWLYHGPEAKWKHGSLSPTLVGLGNVPNTDATNPANIVQTSSYRFVTDAEKATWNASSSSFIPKLDGHETYRGVNYANNSTTETVSGGVTMSTSASAVARSVATTNYATRNIRKGFTASIVSGGRYTGTRGAALLWYLSGGFKYVCDVYISDTAYGAGCRQFYGMQGTTADLTYTDVTLVSSLINCIGVGSDSADANLQIFHNDGSGTATKVDLGASFPANRSAGAALTTIYSIQIYNAPNSSTVLVEVTNKETGAVAQHTLTTDLPATTQGLNFFASRCMGGAGGTTNTGQFDLSILGVYSL